MTQEPGEFALVLHTHLPHLAGYGVWPVGEEWLFQAWGTSWLPVTRVLERFEQDGHRDVVTVSVTPTTAWQLSDARLADEVASWLAGAMWRSEEQRHHHLMGPDVTALSAYWWRYFRDLGDYHADVQARGGLLRVWETLARAGVIELLAGPATHPYLPLEADPNVVDAQLATGLAAHRSWSQWTGGLWPPELGYRPHGSVGDPTVPPVQVDADGTPQLVRGDTVLPGLEEHYERHGVRHIVVDGPTLIRAAGGTERDWTRRPSAARSRASAPEDVLYDGVYVGASQVVAFGRDLSVAYHVWSPEDGYPGSAWYLDHYATGGFGVHRSWRVTDRNVPPDAKEPYLPAAAAQQVTVDAEHFVGVLRDTLADRPGGVVVAAYDTELFGHWWHEGPAWLAEVLTRIVLDPALRTTTLASRRERREPTRRLHLPESSWGFAKGHASWVTEETRPVWQLLRESTALARRALATGRGPIAQREALAREVALLHASDWPFMLTRGRSAGYALERVHGHAERIRLLCAEIDGDRADASTAPTGHRAATVPPDAGAFLAALGG